jgi:hypothetical protein
MSEDACYKVLQKRVAIVTAVGCIPGELSLRSTQSPTHVVPGVKWPGPEADHSPSASDEIMSAWSYTCTAPTSSRRGA